MKKTLLTLSAGFLAAGAAQAAILVYEDNFDNDTLATNAGTGGGGVSNAIKRSVWTDNGDLNLSTPGTNNFDNRAIFYSTNSFQSSEGFDLTVNYTSSSITSAGGTGNQLSFGLVSTDTDLSAYAGSNPFGVTTSVYSLGTNVIGGAGGGTQAYNFTNGTTLNQLDAAGTNASFTTDSEVTLSFGTGGAWSYSIDGVQEASGIFAGGFDLTKSYQFVAYAQDVDFARAIQSVSLSAIPEPSSAALLGLGFAGLLLRRKRN
ncbi:PEP-CTERM sorting domain-containing protein [Luteolibacter sp. AS25]|uniref:PEP-CTERM sorting domain-containing protein n=1 Tax=Luteolibacter sp. AS25 TaxID=3135776 RepID=UPI00398A8D12